MRLTQKECYVEIENNIVLEGLVRLQRMEDLFDTMSTEKLVNVIKAIETIEELLMRSFTNKLKDYSDNNVQDNLEEELEAIEPDIEDASHKQ